MPLQKLSGKCHFLVRFCTSNWSETYFIAWKILICHILPTFDTFILLFVVLNTFITNILISKLISLVTFRNILLLLHFWFHQTLISKILKTQLFAWELSNLSDVLLWPEHKMLFYLQNVWDTVALFCFELSITCSASIEISPAVSEGSSSLVSVESRYRILIDML